MIIALDKQAFNTRQVCQLTGISKRQLIYWDAKGLVKPSIRPAAGRGSQRLFSYGDLLALQTVKSLRDQGASLQRIRKCVQYMRKHLPDISQPLNFCVLLTDGETVYLVEDEKTLIDTVKRQGQRAFLQVSMAALDRQLRRHIVELAGKRVEAIDVGDYSYQVVIEADEDGGYTAEVAGLSGCITQGESLEEVREMARNAIETYLDAVKELKERGIELPVSQRKKRRSRSA